MTTKQQEFLENLKNPTKARIKEAIGCFQESDLNRIEVSITQSIEQGCCENKVTVELISDSYEILLETTTFFTKKLEQFMENTITCKRLFISEEFDGTFKLIYYITES